MRPLLLPNGERSHSGRLWLNNIIIHVDCGAYVFRLVPCCSSLKLFWPIVALSPNAECRVDNALCLWKARIWCVMALVRIWVKIRCVLPLENLQNRVDNASNLQSWNALSENRYYRKYRKNLTGLLEFSITLQKRNIKCKSVQWLFWRTWSILQLSNYFWHTAFRIWDFVILNSFLIIFVADNAFSLWTAEMVQTSSL